MAVILTVLVATVLVGAGFAVERGVARQIGTDFDQPAAALVTGWAVLVLIGVLCALARMPLTVPTLAVGVIGLVGYVAARGAAAGFGRLALAWLLLLPLLAIASAVPGLMHDEFPYQLPNIRFLVETDGFPDAGHPNPETSKPDYPPAFSLIAYAAARFGGIDVAYPGKVFTVLLAGAFGLALARLLVDRVGWLAAIAIGVALATLLNPFFDPRIALTAYYDTPTGFVLALCVAACWRAVGRPFSPWHVHAAAAAMTLIMLRETNVVYVVALAAGLILCREYRVAAGLLPALATFGLWRLYIITAGFTPSIVPRPFATWDFTAPITMVRVLFIDRLLNNPVLGIAGAGFAALGAVLAVWAVRRGDRALRILFWLAGCASVTWCAFLAWAYLGVYDEQAATANSLWRYLTQLGPLMIYLVAAALVALLPARLRVGSGGTAGVSPAPCGGGTPPLQRHVPPRAMAAALGVALCVVPVLGILATWRHWRIDCRLPSVVAARSIAKDLARLQLGQDRIAVIHPEFASWFSEALDYDLRRPVRTSLHFPRADLADPLPWRIDLSALDHGPLIATREVPAIVVERRSGNAWVPALTIPARRLPGCTSPFD
jgi:hypothetical protein